MKSPLTAPVVIFSFYLTLLLFFLSGRAAAEIPSVTVCANNQFLSQPVDDGITYRCAQSCAGSVESCTLCEPGGLCRITVSVAGAGANLFYNPLPGAPTLLFHTGGGGTERYPLEAFEGLRRSGLKVVEIEWTACVTVTNSMGKIFPLGWFTRPNGKPSNLAELSRRPAAIIQFVHDHLAEGQRFGTASCSGGSVATFNAIYFNGVGKLLDYQQIAGGPYYDVGWVCGDGPRELSLNPLAEHVIPIPKIVDYVHKTGTTCQSRKSHPSFAASSPSQVRGDWHFEYPVDFLSTANSRFSDEFLGIRNQALAVMARSRRNSYTLTTDRGAHCAGNQLSACERICERMLGRKVCGCQELQ